MVSLTKVISKASKTKWSQSITHSTFSTFASSLSSDLPLPLEAPGHGKLAVKRDGRSLLNTFPFNAGARGGARSAEHDHHEHDHEHAHHEEQAPSEARLARQGDGDDVPLDIGSIAAAGERCIDKVVMVEETEYDDHIECHHSYSERCHTTYTTDFEPQQEEECEENFKKDCFIEYKKIAVDETGPEECKTVYESECETRYHEHDVEDDVVNCETIQEEKCEDVTQGYTTEQKCTKWPSKSVPPKRRTSRKGSPTTLRTLRCECFDKKETIVQEVPEELCNLEPQKSCKQVTKLECVDIPKEICSRSRKNPRKVKKPVVKKWCYVSLRCFWSGCLGF
ncbi:Uncharacterized protein FKW44_011778 [Caligus rogercresseyi]|uniref:Uncharacterized protein n=1 Tax=Caligus rogercresseyi TaxID=217165 RepID=A0A7T8K931_CALRO|nr:Uncharacterized protein FKW44_011778 [Caligus rogercresseyi]